MNEEEITLLPVVGQEGEHEACGEDCACAAELPLRAQLGLYTTSDIDDDVLEDIPAHVVETIRWVPSTIAALSAGIAVAGYRRGTRMVLTNSLRGKVKKTASPGITAVGSVLASSALAGFAAWPKNQRRSTITAATVATSAALSVVASQVVSMRVKNNKLSIPAVVASAVACAAAETALDIWAARSGLSHITER